MNYIVSKTGMIILFFGIGLLFGALTVHLFLAKKEELIIAVFIFLVGFILGLVAAWGAATG